MINSPQKVIRSNQSIRINQRITHGGLTPLPNEQEEHDGTENSVLVN